MEQLFDAWPVYALILFGIAAGQFARIGQRVDRGERLRLRHLLAELTMLPAFGSLGGVLATAQGWPVWAQLGFGIAAGWMGFGMFGLIIGGLRQAAARFLDSTHGIGT
jgi:hypothetical protein